MVVEGDVDRLAADRAGVLDPSGALAPGLAAGVTSGVADAAGGDGALQERSRLILRSASSAEGGGRSRQVENDPCPDAELALERDVAAEL